MSPDPAHEFSALVDAHKGFVARLARAMMADEHRAEDLVQETWAAVLRRPPEGIRDVRAWLARVLRRRAASHHRGAVRTEELDPDAQRSKAGPADEVLERLELEHLVQESVLALDEPYRTTVFLRYHENLAPREIAARTRVPVKTVKTRLHRGIQRLRQGLTRDLECRDPDRRLGLAPALALLSRHGEAAHASGLPLGPTLLGLTLKKLVVASLALILSLGWLARTVLLRDQTGEMTRIASALEDPDLGAATPLPEKLAPLADRTGSRAELPGKRDVTAKDKPSMGRGASLSIEVRDERGSPIPERWIRLQRAAWVDSGAPAILRATNAAGIVKFLELNPSEYSVADAHGSREMLIELEADDTRSLAWTTTTDLQVDVSAVDSRGRPVPGASIWCASGTGRGAPLVRIGQTGSDGRVKCRCGLNAELLMTAEGFLQTALIPARSLKEVDSGARMARFVLESGGHTLEGIVVDESGRPIKAARLTLVGERALSTVTDPEGRAVMPGSFPIGSVELIARATGFAATTETVHATSPPAPFRLVLHAGVSVSGRVLRPDGSPASRAHVRIAPRGSSPGSGHRQALLTTRCDELGAFAMARVAPGLISLRAEAGWSDAMSSTELDVAVEGQGLSNLTLTLEVGRALRGIVVDSDGLPIEGVVVTAFSGEQRSKDIKTGPDGRFALTSLPESADVADQWDVVVRHWNGVGVRTLTVSRGATPDADPLTLVVERPQDRSAAIIGRVAAGLNPLPGALRIWILDENGHGRTPIEFDPQDGTFTTAALEPGAYRIELKVNGVLQGARSGLSVGPDQTVDAGPIELGVGGQIRLRVPSDVEPMELTAVAVSPGGQRTTLHRSIDAWTHNGVLEPGLWQVHVTPVKGDTSILLADIRAGETAWIEFDPDLPRADR